MNLHIVENGQFVKYERLGKCVQCGACCCTKEIDYKVQVVNENKDDTVESTDYSEFEGYSVFWSQGLWWWMKPRTLDTNRKKPCNQFVDGLCSIWQTDEWPAICRYWPVHPNDLLAFPECGFRFERKEDEQERTTTTD